MIIIINIILVLQAIICIFCIYTSISLYKENIYLFKILNQLKEVIEHCGMVVDTNVAINKNNSELINLITKDINTIKTGIILVSNNIKDIKNKNKTKKS